MNTGKWSNGSWSIEWANEDEVLIIGRHDHQKCKIDGGDFEQILSALCSVKGVSYACFVDSVGGDSSCVWDNNKPKDCVHAANGISRNQCEHWKIQ